MFKLCTCLMLLPAGVNEMELTYVVRGECIDQLVW